MIPLVYDIISDVDISVEYIFLNEQKSIKQFYPFRLTHSPEPHLISVALSQNMLWFFDAVHSNSTIYANNALLWAHNSKPVRVLYSTLA